MYSFLHGLPDEAETLTGPRLADANNDFRSDHLACSLVVPPPFFLFVMLEKMRVCEYLD